MQIVKASGWFNTDLTAAERETLLAAGILPVNDIYEPMFSSDAAIRLIYGSRGGGKSEVVCDDLIEQARTQEYFKCYYGRKIFENVRESCFATLVACIKKRHLTHEFHLSEANTSTMIITHRRTGNKFIPFGSDKADKLKSIKDPTHLWCEEFDQFTMEDFTDLFPTLRTKRGKNLFYATFNTHSVYTDSWIIKTFFPDIYTGERKATDYNVLEGVEVLKIFANFDSNYFIDREDYALKLKMAAGGSRHIYDGIANGAWGVIANEMPWLYAFDMDKHVREVPFLPTYPVYISFDFNNEPFECTAWQFSPNLGTANSFIHCIKEFSGSLKIEEMCHRIKTTFPNSILYVTGDRSGQNEDVGRNQTLYQLIASLLGISFKQLNLNNTNLEHADSRFMINALLANYPNIFIHPECKQLLKQISLATVDIKSNKPHQLLKDRGVYKNDCLDSARYFFQTYFNKFAKDTYFKVMKK